MLINPRKTADEQFAAPIRARFQQQYPNFIVQEFTSAYAFETRMIKGKRYAVIVCSAEMSAIKDCDVVLLAVKPQNMDEVLPSMGKVISEKTLIISIAVGIT